MTKKEQKNKVENYIVKALSAFDNLSEITEKYDDYRSQLYDLYDDFCYADESESA